MVAPLQLELVTPEALLLSEAVGMVVLPGIEGDMGVMANHAPTVSTLRPGVVSIYEEPNGPVTQRLFVGGGVAEVTGTRCILLAEEANNVNGLSKVQAQARLTEAEAALAAADTDAQQTEAASELAIAKAQMTAVDGR